MCVSVCVCVRERERLREREREREREIYQEIASILGEGNGTPLPYSCLENPMDGGAW